MSPGVSKVSFDFGQTNLTASARSKQRHLEVGVGHPSCPCHSCGPCWLATIAWMDPPSLQHHLCLVLGWTQKRSKMGSHASSHGRLFQQVRISFLVARHDDSWISDASERYTLPWRECQTTICWTACIVGLNPSTGSSFQKGKITWRDSKYSVYTI